MQLIAIVDDQYARVTHFQTIMKQLAGTYKVPVATRFKYRYRGSQNWTKQKRLASGAPLPQ